MRECESRRRWFLNLATTGTAGTETQNSHTHKVDPNILYVMCRGGMQCVVTENVLYVLNRKRAKANESEFEKIMNRIIFLKKKNN